MRIVVACSREGCGGANFSGFRFCQVCGHRRKQVTITDSDVVVDDVSIAQRRREIMATFDNKSHEKSKVKELDGLMHFLSTRPTDQLRRESVFEAVPSDIVDFLIFRDLTGNGRTVVHARDCTMRDSCACPKRLSQSATQALLSKVKTKLYEMGCSGAWCGPTGTGNPADSALVDKYLTAIKEEQGRAGCVGVTARQRAMMPEKLEKLIISMRKEAYRYFVKDTQRFVTILQDIAWITLQYRTLNRGAELSDLRTDTTIIGPNDSCVVFQVSFSKVIRGDSVKEFGAPAMPNDSTCPVRAFLEYKKESSKELGWEWDTGSFPVFPYIGRRGDRLQAVSPQAMGQRFRKHLERVNMRIEGDETKPLVVESLHGLRAGGALHMALMGRSLRDIMVQGFWRSPKTALRYIGMLEKLIGQEFKDAVRDKGYLKELPRLSSAA